MCSVATAWHERILNTTHAGSSAERKEFFAIGRQTAVERICHSCGARTHVGRNCPKCGREISRDKLIQLAKAGRKAALRPEARRKHSKTQKLHETAKRAWRAARQPVWLDEPTYIREIQPRLASVTISTISSTLRVCESYAADIRSGRHRPHPRHWRELAELVGISKEKVEC